MDKHQELASIVSEMNSIIREFMKKAPEENAIDVLQERIGMICVKQRLIDLKKAADDVVRDTELSRDGITQEDIDLLRAYLEEIKELVNGRI